MTEIEVEGKNTVHGSEISEPFNDYFTNIGPKLAAESTSNSSNNVHKCLKTNKLNYPLFSFENVLVENVLLTLRHLQTSKSTGLDNISGIIFTPPKCMRGFYFKEICKTGRPCYLELAKH